MPPKKNNNKTISQNDIKSEQLKNNTNDIKSEEINNNTNDIKSDKPKLIKNKKNTNLVNDIDNINNKSKSKKNDNKVIRQTFNKSEPNIINITSDNDKSLEEVLQNNGVSQDQIEMIKKITGNTNNKEIRETVTDHLKVQLQFIKLKYELQYHAGIYNSLYEQLKSLIDIHPFLKEYIQE
jgi:hypothetical protein